AELQLRGFLSLDERRAGTDQYGMSHVDSDRLYDVLGRSIPVHQITTGLARGGEYNGSAANIPASYLASLQPGNLRPADYNLAYANRDATRRAFVVRALRTDGTLPPAEGEQIFLNSGWQPALAKQVADHYGGISAPVKHPNVAKAEVQLWGTLHRSFVNG